VSSIHDGEDADPDDDYDPKVLKLKDKFEGFVPSPLPLAPDGGVAPGPPIALSSIPEAIPANFVCLRGPCRYYFEIASHFEGEAPEGITPKQFSRVCTVVKGVETDITDNVIYACNMWAPITIASLIRKKINKIDYMIRKTFQEWATHGRDP